MTKRVFNFSPGPATLPLEILEKAGADLVNFGGSGIGIAEISHRSPEFQAVVNEAEQNLRDLLEIPDNYKVLFLQGGASSQFFMIPMNLLGKGKKATYLNTGTWAKKAIKEAKLFGDIQTLNISTMFPTIQSTEPPLPMPQRQRQCSFVI